jgi:hypothetical protein
MATIKKAQKGVKASTDSTNFYRRRMLSDMDMEFRSSGDTKKTYSRKVSQSAENLSRQSKKGKPGYDKDGFPIKKQRSGGKTPAWQRKEGKNPEGGLNAKGVASYRAANPGSKLKTAVTTKPSKLKPGSKAASRRKSFCSRMSGMKKKLTSAKTANDPNSRINKSLRKWNC